MKTPPQNYHLCAYCRRVVSVIGKGKIVKELPLSESGFTVKDFDLPGASHGICVECDRIEREKIQAMKTARKQGRVVENPPVWAADKAKWAEALRIVRHSYGF